MAIHRLDKYDSQGRLRLGSDTWFLYVALADMDAASVIAKVGISTKPYERLGSIHANSPFGVDMAAFAVVGSKRRALRCESTILEKFNEFSTRGEWLRLPSAPEMRARFATETKAVVQLVTGRPVEWRRLTREQIVGAISERIRTNAA